MNLGMQKKEFTIVNVDEEDYFIGGIFVIEALSSISLFITLTV